MRANFQVEITDPAEFHCFKLTLNPRAQPDDEDAPRIEIMLHAVSLVDLINECSMALCQWQKLATEDLIRRLTGMTSDELRAKGLIA
jgi:hypothetical protein